MLARVLAFSVCCAWQLVGCERSADSKVFYVVKQEKTTSGAWGEWLIQGPPRSADGVYIFTPYHSNIEKRIPIEGSGVLRIGPKFERTQEFFSAELRTPVRTSAPKPPHASTPTKSI